MLPLLLLLPCLSFVPRASAEKGLEFPHYDGKDRVLDINDKNYKKALKTHSMVCLFYHGPIPDAKDLQKQHQMTELVLEVQYEAGCRSRPGNKLRQLIQRERNGDDFKNNAGTYSFYDLIDLGRRVYVEIFTLLCYINHRTYC